MTELDRDLREAVDALRAGQLVGLPTETVYGLAADARNTQAVARIFAAKGRPADHPLIVHLASADQLDDWAREIPEAARRLAAAFWPGPLTLILKRQPDVPDAVTGGQDTVGLRVPAHPVAHAVLSAFGGGLAAPSANRFGRISPTTAAHVREEVGEAVGLVLDGGPCRVGIESTIVDLTREVPVVLRPGAISAAAISAVLSRDVEAGIRDNAPRVSGSLAAHYAPRTPMRLVPATTLDAEAALASARGLRLAVLALHPAPASLARVNWQRAPAMPEAYAQDLYASLRALDAAGMDLILVEQLPETADWLAVRDRLMRAEHGSGVAGDPA